MPKAHEPEAAALVLGLGQRLGYVLRRPCTTLTAACLSCCQLHGHGQRLAVSSPSIQHFSSKLSLWLLLHDSTAQQGHPYHVGPAPISSSIFSTASLAPPWAGPHRAAMPEATQAKGLAWLEPAPTMPQVMITCSADFQHCMLQSQVWQLRSLAASAELEAAAMVRWCPTGNPPAVRTVDVLAFCSWSRWRMRMICSAHPCQFGSARSDLPHACQMMHRATIVVLIAWPT